MKEGSKEFEPSFILLDIFHSNNRLNKHEERRAYEDSNEKEDIMEEILKTAIFKEADETLKRYWKEPENQTLPGKWSACINIMKNAGIWEEYQKVRGHHAETGSFFSYQEYSLLLAALRRERKVREETDGLTQEGKVRCVDIMNQLENKIREIQYHLKYPTLEQK